MIRHSRNFEKLIFTAIIHNIRNSEVMLFSRRCLLGNNPYLYISSAFFVNHVLYVIVWTRFIAIWQIAVCYIPRHNSLQSVNQLRETGASCGIVLPAWRHQFMSFKYEKGYHIFLRVCGEIQSKKQNLLAIRIKWQGENYFKIKFYSHFIAAHIRFFHAITIL